MVKLELIKLAELEQILTQILHQDHNRVQSEGAQVPMLVLQM